MLNRFATQGGRHASKYLQAHRSSSNVEALKEVDFLVVGGGVIGSSVAHWLKKRSPDLKVLVLEKDPTYKQCSTTLSAGGIRQQFSLKENIQMSMFGADFLKNYRKHLGEDAPDPQYTQEGYLFLATTDASAATMEANVKLQRELGAEVELLGPQQLKAKFPYLNTLGIKLASYGTNNEGWLDPWSLLNGLKKSATQRGAVYLCGELVDFRFLRLHNNRVEGRDYESTNMAYIKDNNGDIQEVAFDKLVIAAGASSGAVGKCLRMGDGPGTLATPIPVEPRKRYVYTIHAPDAPKVGFPFLIDSSGAYCRREGSGGHFICGKSPAPHEESDNMDLEDVDYTPFEEQVWPTLANRAPSCFENIKLLKGWSGFYDYNVLDKNAIVGRHTYYNNVYMATGFSGHGLQMAPAAGMALVELMLDGRYSTIDLTRFGFERCLSNEPIYEQAIV